MKIRFALPMICAMACAGMMVGSGRLAAQQSLPFDVELAETETNVAITPGGLHQFHLTVRNTSNENITMKVVRVANNLPGEDWSSTICFGGLCYDAGTSMPEPAQIKPGKATSCELTIAGGFDVDKSATVTLRFTVGFNPQAVEKTFVVTTSSANSVPDQPALTIAPAYPNPASSYALLPVPAGASATTATLGLYNVRGERVADLTADLRQAIESGSASVRIGLEGLPSGSYIYRVAVDGRETARTLNIVR